MTIVFLVGPSGAGKSELAKGALPRVLGARLLDLDGVDRAAGTEVWGEDWAERRWERDLVRLQAAESAGGLVVVDVGAGSIHTPSGQAYFRERRATCITVIADPRVVYARKHAGKRTYENLLEAEYGPKRTEVYGASTYTIDTSAGDLSRNTDELVQAIQELAK